MPMQRNFAFRDLFNYQLTRLEEFGTLSHLRKKWIFNREYSVDHICKRTDIDSQSAVHDKVVWENVTGIFWLLLAGIVACVVVVVIERVYWMSSSSLSYAV